MTYMTKMSMHREPTAGDVVIFHPDFGVNSGSSWFNDDVFIKRIVAVAGDTVEVRLPLATSKARAERV